MDKDIIEIDAALDLDDVKVYKFINETRKRSVEDDFNIHLAAILKFILFRKFRDRSRLSAISGWILRLSHMQMPPKVKPFKVIKYFLTPA